MEQGIIPNLTAEIFAEIFIGVLTEVAIEVFII
jgi:hypothetical protein